MDLRLVTRVSAENPIEGDLEMRDGQLVFVSGVDAVAQDLTVRLRWFRGEWFLDTRTGMPWFERVLGHKRGDRIAEALIRRVVMSTPGVAKIETMKVTLDRATRGLNVTLMARTKSGAPLTFTNFVIGDSL